MAYFLDGWCSKGPLIVGLDFSCDSKGDERTVAVLVRDILHADHARGDCVLY